MIWGFYVFFRNFQIFWWFSSKVMFYTWRSYSSGNRFLFCRLQYYYLIVIHFFKQHFFVFLHIHILFATFHNSQIFFYPLTHIQTRYYRGWAFTLWFLERISRVLWAKERKSNLINSDGATERRKRFALGHKKGKNI